MAPYDDSDSSGGEEAEYTETNVLLGYASKDADDDTISRLGGRPVCHGMDSPSDSLKLTLVRRTGSKAHRPLPRPSRDVSYAKT
jgi:hypothetical protein